MAFPCVSCNHPERAALDLALASGQTDSEVARRFGIKWPSAVKRHRLSHQALALTGEVVVLDPGDDLPDVPSQARVKSLIATIEKTLATIDPVMVDDYGRSSASTWVSVVAELRKTMEFLAKLSGELSSGNNTTVQVLNVGSNPDFLKYLELIDQALKPFPAARQAVSDALADV